MNKFKFLDFTGETIYCGIDVHKQSWRVNLRSREFELEQYCQNPNSSELVKHLRKRYPQANYKVAYEAGFCGFGIYRSLKKEGIDCLVVNAADVPTSDKEKRRKQDKVDARKICRELSAGKLSGIYVPEIDWEHSRSLVRGRTRLVWDQTRCKNRIWHLLMFSGLSVNEQKRHQYWSKKFVTQLREMDCGSRSLRQTLDVALDQYIFVRELLYKITKQLRSLSNEKPFTALHSILRSIPGIGLINAMVLQTEIQNMKRFRTLDHLCAFTGIVPDMSGSGEEESIMGITNRGNYYLRSCIIESSWVIIRKDPAMLMKYKKYCSRMDENKAIIKIARHLLSRIRYVWLNQKRYESGTV